MTTTSCEIPLLSSAPIVFESYQPQPGHLDILACLNEAQALAAQIRPGIIKDADLGVRERWRNMRRKGKALRSVICNYLINRRRYGSGNHSLRPLYVIWTLCNSCNFRCGYCDNHQGAHYFDVSEPTRLDTAQGKRLLEVMRTGTPAIYWCGGESTLRNDLPELLDYACDLGYFPNMINTNGSLLHRCLGNPAWHRFLQQMDIIFRTQPSQNYLCRLPAARASNRQRSRRSPIVKTRMCRSGIRWSPKRGQRILDLRTYVLSNRWDAFGSEYKQLL